MRTLGEVLDLSAAAAEKAAAKRRHPGTMLAAPFTGARRSAGVLVGMLAVAPADRVDAHIYGDDGGVIVLDYSHSRHAAGDVRTACQALGMVVEELAAETPDGCAAVELRGTDLLDGVLRVVRATIPVPATWGVV